MKDVKYNFGSAGTVTIYEAVEYFISTSIALAGEKPFMEELEERHRKIVHRAFVTAIEAVAKQTRFQRLVESLDNFAYTSEESTSLDNIFVEAVKSVRDMLWRSNPVRGVDEGLYDAYVVVNLMENHLRTGKSDCSQFIGLTPSEIIDVYGKAHVLSENPPEDVVLKMNARGTLDALVYSVARKPVHAAQLVRKQFIRSYAKARTAILKRSVFTVFFESVISRTYSNIENKRSAIQKALSSISVTKQLSIMDRVYKLYKLGIISVPDFDVGKLQIPSAEDINSIETYVAPPVASFAPVSTEFTYLEDTDLRYDNVVNVYIDNMKFSTIADYVAYTITGKRVYEFPLYDVDMGVGSPYSLVSTELYDRCLNKAFYENEVGNTGKKLSKSLFRKSFSEYSGNDLIRQKVSHDCVTFGHLLQSNPEFVASDPILFSAVFWVNARMFEIETTADIVDDIASKGTVSDIARILIGKCIDNISAPILKSIKLGLYKMMRDVLVLNSDISPRDVVEFARRTVTVPEKASAVPRQIRNTVFAVSRVSEALKKVSDVDEYLITIYAVNVIVGAYIENPEAVEIYDEDAGIIARELGVSEKTAAFVNGFAKTLSPDNDQIQRKILFFSNI